VKTWLADNKVEKTTVLKPDLGPDSAIFARYKDLLKDNADDLNRYNIWNNPAYTSKVSPVAVSDVCSGVYTCINLATVLDYRDRFGTLLSPEDSEFPGSPFIGPDDFDKRVLGAKWGDKLPSGRTAAFRRNLHLVVMACKSASLSKHVIQLKTMDERYECIVENEMWSAIWTERCCSRTSCDELRLQGRVKDSQLRCFRLVGLIKTSRCLLLGSLT
jgi:hypothetical protein